MMHILDNPAYNALLSGNKNLSNGTDAVKYFSKDVAPFVGFLETSDANFKTLADIVPFENVLIYISPVAIDIPKTWKLIVVVPGFQMVYNKQLAPLPNASGIVPLNESNIPEMLALTQLTNPGPFLANTIAFGNYKGIFVDGKLVAMAGYRLHVFNYVEISAVCTHPDHLGKGYAKKLMQSLMQDIQSNSKIPFLHVKSENERAIHVYKKLGFDVRTAIFFYIIQKSESL